jgi:hypothetical protein
MGVNVFLPRAFLVSHAMDDSPVMDLINDILSLEALIDFQRVLCLPVFSSPVAVTLSKSSFLVAKV